MMYIAPTRRENGSYGNMQSNRAPGLVAFPDEMMGEFFKDGKQAAGFCVIEHDGETVTSCTWDEDAYQAYIAALPDPVDPPPTTEERVAALEAENKLLMEQVSAQSAVASITFVTLCEVGTLDMVTASEHAELFAEWAYPVAYTVGQLRRYNGTLYKCVQAHTSQADWTPDTAVSLWSVAADPAEEWPAWSQPVGAHDAYVKGEKVSHNGKHWTSSVDSNVWEPGVYGWTEATE